MIVEIQSAALSERLAGRRGSHAPAAELREPPPWSEGPDPKALLGALQRAFDGAIAAGKHEAAARIVAEAAKFKKARPAEPDGPHPWERFRSKFT
ncbi:MAG TPA: hypothetical protein VGH15_00775 [Caulobacteraceae bacterium]